MEVENCDKSTDEIESEVRTVPNEKEQMDEDKDGVISVSDQSEETTDTVVPELTLVVIGDTSSINIGPNNILIDHNEQMEQFSARLYDLCGRRISVINMLGLKQVPLNQEVHAFVLLVRNGPHAEHYKSGLQWLEQTFGEESLSHVLTAVTHEPDENCERALTDLVTNSSFDENRFHTCSIGMMDGNEIIELVKKIDSMVSENHPDCYNRKMIDESKEQKQQLEPKAHREVKMDLMITSTQVEELDDNVEDNTIQCGPYKKSHTVEESNIRTLAPSTTSEKEFDCGEDSTEKEDKNKGRDVSKCSTDETDELKDKSQTSQTVSSVSTEVTISSNTNMKKQYQEETEAIFNRLHLQDKLEQKMSPANFLMIGSSVKPDHETFEKDLACTFIQRLMMLDYRARYIPVKQQCPEVRNSVVRTVTVGTDESDDDDFYSASVEPDQLKQTHVHPMDVQMAVFHCSDSFLQQNMVTKLSQCQYALPLLVPHPLTGDVQFPLWTFRQIKKTWKTSTKDGVTMKSVPVYKAQTPMVSFLRLGSLSVSKSQLMNDLINERHSTFFHRNCAGSTKSRLLMDGVVEIAWYCPAGKANDAFTDCIAFCNLHGDALEFKQQRDILVEKSSVNVVLVPTLEKGDKGSSIIKALLKSEKPLICLIVDDSCDAFETRKGKYKIGLKDRSQSDVSAELKRITGNILSEPHKSFQLETLAEVSGLRVDENEPMYQNKKSNALEVVHLFKEMDVSEIKNTFFLYQGELWHKWCKINKELYHLKGHIEKEKCKKQQELKQIRQDQCKASYSKVMKLFIHGLSSLPATDKTYFLKWTQILIDALSTDDLTSILQSYDEKWTEVLALKKNHEKSDQLKNKQTELEQISKKLQSATFGLEHIFREMGQIYEAHKSLNKRPEEVLTNWSKYPELAAELMISGHPMELMDGDAGHVPLTWVSSVLDEVRRKVGERRVFVLSVLGVQSSGKSTMLNAMFGLQFAVSAGRCTKGAFMQLVKVSEEMKHLKFEYVLVVDTEGLRALELEGHNTLHHDNELATLVVGLGNMTLINIFGENPTEMQDVLQIVVQAFMRMKKVKLSPSCVFVHQNVTDITATEKNMDGKRRLQEKLDQMVQLAAKEEGSDAQCFSDIIAFDVQTDVKYFAQLWEGSPPMAPPNPGYSESVQELKDFILSKASQSDGSLVTLSQFRGKIQDLWNALLQENFVFSFKNTLEIIVYRKLEVQYGNWTWTLRSNMLTIENQLHTRIENGKLDKVEINYLYKEINKTYEEIINEMTKYFEDNTDKEMLVQWKERFKNKIKGFHDEQVREVKRKLDEVLQQKKACKKLDSQKTEFENKLLQQSKELAHKLKDKDKDEEELKKQFNCMWSDWVTELTANTTPIQDISFEDDQFNVLQDLGIDPTLIVQSIRSDEYRNISKIGDYSKYVCTNKQQEQVGCDTSQQLEDKRKDKKGQGFSITSAWASVKRVFGYGSTHQIKLETSSVLPYNEQMCIRSFIDYAEQQTHKILKSKPLTTRGYSSTYLQEMAKAVKDEVTEFESQRKYALKKEFTVDLLLFLFDRVKRWISESQETFKKNNDAATFVDSKKSQYYNVFSSFCKGSSSAVVLGELICEKLKVSSVEAVCNQTAIDLATVMRCDYPAFNGNRLNLEKHVLKSLAKKGNFEDFITYIRKPKQQVKKFIKEEVNKYITETKDKAEKILKQNVDDIKMLVIRALSTATDKVKEGGDVNTWLKEFSSLLKDNMTFDTISSQSFSDINNFDFLKEETEKGLVYIIDDMKSMSLDKLNNSRLQPDQMLIDQLCRCCWAKCPFCAAVCTNTLEDHSPDKHNVPFHRPSGIKGWHVRHTVDLVIDFCTTLVASDRSFYPCHDSEESVPYKQYQNGGAKYASWMITADESKLTYWKWFVCKFQKQLEVYYNLKFQNRGEIPSEWRNLTKEDAIKSLDEMCNE